jgi:hypothetical protein
VDCTGGSRALGLRSDGAGRWQDTNGAHLSPLAGCEDIDIWPTPFTNSVPIWRSHLAIGERRLYRFENLDGSGFQADLTVDENGLVTDYPGYFARVPV